MASDPLTCSLLRTLAALKPSGRFLERGPGAGLSSAWILEGVDKAASLTTVDIDDSLFGILEIHLGPCPRLVTVYFDGPLACNLLIVNTLTSCFQIHVQEWTVFLMRPFSGLGLESFAALTICLRS